MSGITPSGIWCLLPARSFLKEDLMSIFVRSCDLKDTVSLRLNHVRTSRLSNKDAQKYLWDQNSLYLSGKSPHSSPTNFPRKCISSFIWHDILVGRECTQKELCQLVYSCSDTARTHTVWWCALRMKRCTYRCWKISMTDVTSIGNALEYTDNTLKVVEPSTVLQLISKR